MCESTSSTNQPLITKDDHINKPNNMALCTALLLHSLYFFALCVDLSKPINASLNHDIFHNEKSKFVLAKDADLGEYPFMVMVLRSVLFPTSNVPYCSGSVISETEVLVPQDCVLMREGPTPNRTVISVLAAIVDIDNEDSGQWRYATRISLPSPYFATIEVQSPFFFNWRLKSATVSNWPLIGNESCVVLFWATKPRKDFDRWSLVLKKLPVQIISCEIEDNYTTVCVTPLDPDSSACMDDIGSQLFCEKSLVGGAVHLDPDGSCRMAPGQNNTVIYKYVAEHVPQAERSLPALMTFQEEDVRNDVKRLAASVQILLNISIWTVVALGILT